VWVNNLTVFRLNRLIFLNFELLRGGVGSPGDFLTWKLLFGRSFLNKNINKADIIKGEPVLKFD
jgi:hypothetical protein